MVLVVKNSPANAGDIRNVGPILVSGGSLERGHGNPLQYFCLKIPWKEELVRLQSIGLERVGHN